LLELMIGIAILGLGMVMVATIFPVAWSRARTLSEYTAEQSVTSGAFAKIKTLVHVSGRSTGSSSFLGDLLRDDLKGEPIRACKDWPDEFEFYTDTSVHALNLENIRVENQAFVAEDPWRIEAPHLAALISRGDLPDELVSSAYFSPQVRLYQRVYPPLERRENVAADGVFEDDDNRWDDAFGTRRFGWALLHRLSEPIEHEDITRSFDLFIVTLRRPNPNYRYARQDGEKPVPDACNVTGGPVVPEARPAEDDVMFPVPWRVQVQFPDTMASRDDPTGVPTEVLVPPSDASDDEEVNRMLAGMFPTGTYFIDEITGDVYKVVQRRETDATGQLAYLTLDRPLKPTPEVFREDLHIDQNDPRCPDPYCNNSELDDAELLRTVWVFPPSVEATRGPKDTLVFEGNQPVVGISVRNLLVAPVTRN
jgi:hypothetical protein